MQKHGVQMVKQMNNIINDIDDLFNKLKESNIYKEYLEVTKKLGENKDIKKIINEIKKYQKIGTNNKDNSVEKKLKELYKKLESYPLYQSYLIIKEQLEDELFNIKELFDKYFNDILKIDY